MNQEKPVIPPLFRAVGSAICAIVHASIDEFSCFAASSTNKMAFISALGKQIYSDQGVTVESDQGRITVRVQVSVKTGSQAILNNSMKLQRKISEEVYALTRFKVENVHMAITGIISP